MKIMITGSAGFIGQNFADYFRGYDHEVLGFDKQNDNRDDCLNFSTLRYAAAPADVVIHLAANPGIPASIENPLLSRDDFLMTFNVLELARLDSKHVVLASSIASRHPKSPYAASKLALEGMAMAYMNCYECDITTVVIPNVYGPYCNEKNTVVHRFLRQSILGLPHTIYDGGNQLRNFIFAQKLAHVTLRAIEQGEIFVDASNYADTCTINEISNLINSGALPLEIQITHDWLEKRKEVWRHQHELFSE